MAAPGAGSWTSSPASSSSAAPALQDTLFQAVESYPWATDDEFQAGLRAILGQTSVAGTTTQGPEQTENLALRARCYYYERKHNVPIDFSAYCTWRAKHTAPAPSLPVSISSTTAGTSNTTQMSPPESMTTTSTTSSEIPSVSVVETTPHSEMTAAEPPPPPPYPMSFQKIVELITKGEPIPGVKEIPDTVLEGQASQSKTNKRRKPWEKDGGQEAIGVERIATSPTR